MSRTHEKLPEVRDPASDLALWRRSRVADAPEDEEARLLDLAAFADRRLDPDEHDRVESLLAADPQAASDVAAARRLAAEDLPPPAEIERIAARAAALVSAAPAAPAGGLLLAWRRARILRAAGRRAALRYAAQWGSLAAAAALAGWLGFAMGSNTLSALSAGAPGINANAQLELLDPGTGFLHDPGAGTQT